MSENEKPKVVLQSETRIIKDRELSIHSQQPTASAPTTPPPPKPKR